MRETLREQITVGSIQTNDQSMHLVHIHATRMIVARLMTNLSKEDSLVWYMEDVSLMWIWDYMTLMKSGNIKIWKFLA